MGFNTPNYREQGGARDVIGGSIDVISGGELDIESGGALKIAGVAVAASAAELNYNDITTLGTVQASKVVSADANKDVSSTAGSTGFATLVNYGTINLSCTGSTATSLCGFRLPAPVAGSDVVIRAHVGIDATHDAIVETTSAGISIDANTHRLAFDAENEVVHLRGLSATQWSLVSNPNGVASSTDVTT